MISEVASTLVGNSTRSKLASLARLSMAAGVTTWSAVYNLGDQLWTCIWEDLFSTTKASKQTRHEMVSLTKAARQELLKL